MGGPNADGNAASPAASANQPATNATSSAPLAVPQVARAADNWLYTSEIAPQTQVTVVTEIDGRVIGMNVAVGDSVSRGQTLLQLESATLEAVRANALATLEATQAELETLQLPPSEMEIEAARAAIIAAEAAYQRLVNGPSATEIAVVEAELFEAEAALRRAQAAYDQMAWNPLLASLPEAAALQAAQLAMESAQARYAALTASAAQELISSAYADVAAARAVLQELEAGPDDALLRTAEANVRQAETALYLAQLQLDKTIVRAPVGGVVAATQLITGAMAAANAPALLIVSPETELVIQVEEARMAALYVGQAARIETLAYPGQIYTGTVAAIAPQIDRATRTVQVTVELVASKNGDAPTSLRPGMFATVELILTDAATDTE
jgi:HlyD family secretion protein